MAVSTDPGILLNKINKTNPLQEYQANQSKGTSTVQFPTYTRSICP